MLEATLNRAGLLKKIIDSIIALVQEVNFDCTPNGIALQAMDPAYVSLITILLRSDGFSHYRCDRSLSLGVNLESLQKVLKVAGNDDTLTLRAEDDGESLTLLFENKNKHSDFNLKLNNIEAHKVGIPNMEYEASVRLPSNEFQKIIQSLQPLGDAGVDNDGVAFEIKGNLGSGKTLIKQSASVDEEVSTTVDVKKEIALAFAIRYLGFFTKATNLSSVVTLSLSSNVPLCVEYPIEEVVESGKEKEVLGYIRFHLAPKVDE